MPFPPCPRCGATCGVHVRAQCHGPATVYFDQEGKELAVETGCLWTDRSQVVRCDDCGKIRRDLRCAGSDVIRVLEGNG